MKNVVRELRTTKGLSQADLAAAMGVSRQTINAGETGRYLPSLPLAIGLARFFSSSVEQVFEPDEERRAAPAGGTFGEPVFLRPHDWVVP